MDCPGRAVRAGPGFGEGGGCWSLSCQIAALASPPTPRAQAGLRLELQAETRGLGLPRCT